VRLLFYAIISFYFQSLGIAELGESLDQIKKRYGDPILHAEKSYRFTKNGFILDFKFEDGVASQLDIRYENSEFTHLSLVTVTALLERFKPKNEKGQWTEASKIFNEEQMRQMAKGVRLWIFAPEGNMFAAWHVEEDFLKIMLGSGIEKVVDRQAEQIKGL